ncbi:HNH endonuclease [Micrococcus luteus]|uniref:HNH endonuclease n=1 Tax=Micrococcus luteus TaxID=1270 RepID=UPI00352C75BD
MRHRPPWPDRRKAVIQRDRGLCVLCGSKGTHADHIVRGMDHSLANLRLLCRSCHMKRTGSDGVRTKRSPKRK